MTLLVACGHGMTYVFAAPSTDILDRYGHPLRVLQPGGEGLSRPVPLDAVSPWMILATLAAEDRRFFRHPGVDFQSTARALLQNTTRGRVVSGGSTITQQLVRLLEPRPKTLRGKAKEAFQALWLEKRMTKREILERYLNSVSYGHHALGVEAAAQTYFQIPSRDLSLGQAALLAGLPKSPVRYDPLVSPERARERQRTVLARMESWGWLSPEAAALARAEKIDVVKMPAPWIAPHFTDYIRRTAPAPQAVLATTLDAGLQDALQGMLRSHIAGLKTSHVTNGAVVVIDNRRGEVLGWVGSADFHNAAHQGQVDGVTARRQPGSALKPFLYGLALAKGWTASDLLLDAPLEDPGYRPKNYDETYHGPVRLREALACSFNVPAVRLGQSLGIGAVLHTLHAFGLDSLERSADYYGPGLVLGNGEVTLLELTNAYAALARGGIWMPVKTWKDQPGLPPSRRVLDRESAALVTDILSDNMARARAFGLNSPFHLPFALAAKTGTTKDYHDNWALGYTPEWTIGVWVGNFDAAPMRGISGITGAAPLLRDAALLLHQRLGSTPFRRPATLREADICPESGLLSGAFCPTTLQEWYSRQHRPAAGCRLHQAPEQPRDPAPEPLRIEFPVSGDVFKLDPHAPRRSQMLRFKATRPAGPDWRLSVDGREMPMQDGEAWWPLQPGRHVVTLQRASRPRADQVPAVHFLVLP